MISVDGSAFAHAEGRHHETEIVLYERAIEIARRTLGDDHPATIRIIDEYNRLATAPAAPRDDSEE